MDTDPGNRDAVDTDPGNEGLPAELFGPGGPPRLADDRVVLRALRDEDVPDLVEISYYDGRPARDESQALAMLRRIRSDSARGAGLHWGVTLAAEEDAVAGTCGFYRGFADRVGEVGYGLHPAYRGRGLMTAAVRLLVSFGFERLGLRRIVAYTARDNTPSVAVLLRAGFEEVATQAGDRAFERLPPAAEAAPPD